MGMIKGQREWDKFKRGEDLSRTECIKAHCYDCNGREDSRIDCKGFNCPLYRYQPYRSK